MRALEGHTRDDLPALADLARGGIIRVCRYAGEVGGKERLSVGAERDAVVGLGPRLVSCSQFKDSIGKETQSTYRSADDLRVGLHAHDIPLVLQNEPPNTLATALGYQQVSRGIHHNVPRLAEAGC
jgi:hypothetical protein